MDITLMQQTQIPIKLYYNNINIWSKLNQHRVTITHITMHQDPMFRLHGDIM